MSEQYHDFRRYGLSADAVGILLRTGMHERPNAYAGATGDDGDGCPVVCGAPGCGAIVPLRLAHAGRIEHNYTAGIDPASRCAHPHADSGQHFGCSLEHLRAALVECFDNHLLPQVQASQTALAGRTAAASAAPSPIPSPQPPAKGY